MVKIPDDNSPKTVTTEIASILSDESLQHTLGMSGQRYYEDHFSMAQTIATLLRDEST